MSSTASASTDVKGSTISSSQGSKSQFKLTDSVILDYVKATLASNTSAALGGSMLSDCKGSVACKEDAKVGPSTALQTDIATVKKSKLFQMVKSAGKKSLKPIRLTLPFSFSLANTGVGLCTAVLQIDPSISTEWTSLQALYDEYKMHGFRCEYALISSCVGSTADSMLVLAWDPVDATALTSVRNGCELTHHKLHALPNVSGANGTLANGTPLKFSVSIRNQESLTISSTGQVTGSPGSWKNLPTSGSIGSYDGALKVYNVNSGGNGVAQVVGILYMDISFRSRT
jgi:hypothetical protein